MSIIARKLIGEKRGKLTVLSVSNITGPKGQPYINCKCDCGKKTEVRVNNFKSGKGLSCGCNNRKNIKLNRVNIVITKNPGSKAALSEERRKLGYDRRRIEDIKSQQALDREFSLDNY